MPYLPPNLRTIQWYKLWAGRDWDRCRNGYNVRQVRTQALRRMRKAHIPANKLARRPSF